MANVGDKFIIEITDVFKAKGTYKAYGGEENEYEEKLYRIKGFKTLVLNEYGLAELEKYEPEKSADPPPVKVGDEVEDQFGARWFVTSVFKLSGGVFAVTGVGRDGRVHTSSTWEGIKPTGYFNWTIVDALKA